MFYLVDDQQKRSSYTVFVYIETSPFWISRANYHMNMDVRDFARLARVAYPVSI